MTNVTNTSGSDYDDFRQVDKPLAKPPLPKVEFAYQTRQTF